MTEDLIAMAKLAGYDLEKDQTCREVSTSEIFSTFSRLVEALAVARTREECADACNQVSRLAQKDWKARYDPHDQGREFGADECESAIRALGERT